MSETTAGFPPIIGGTPKVLVLGTLPSVKSVEKQQYYGHPQNGFWKIMAALVGATGDYDMRRAALIESRIAVWDVLQSSVRPGSMDADIDLGTASANPLAELVNEQASIARVCFNGQKARQLFDRFVDIATLRDNVMLVNLPSTSPAYASMSLAEKSRHWRDALRPVIDLKEPDAQGERE